MSSPSASTADRRSLPRHVGIIMDGNGRWAKNRNLRRSLGHREGLEAAKRVVKAAADLGLPFMSLYAFSTENWRRAPSEVKYLMGLVLKNLRKEYEFYRSNNVRLVHSGDLDGLPENVRREIMLVQEDTKAFDGTVVNLALNYGGRDEIVRAVNRWLGSNGAPGAQTGRSVTCTEQDLRENLDLPYFPEPDLIVRTAGEKRLSNFLLWECAYAELVFSDKMWPDWTGADLEESIAEYQHRQRRFGGR